MRAIGYFHLPEDTPDSLRQLQGAFNEYCRVNLHQPVTTFASILQGGERQKLEYRRMIDFMRSSGSEFLVVVPDASHLGPDLESVARSMVELDQLGAGVTCSDEEFPDTLQNALQTLGVKGVSRTRSQRIKESMRTRALQGQALGRPLFGYRIGPHGILEVVTLEAAVVELIFRLYIKDGLGLRLIAQHLNDRQISTRRGGNWNVVSIRDILKNIAYTGTYERLGMRRPRTHQAIIPPDLFRAAQDVTRSRRPIGRVMDPQPFLLSGMAYCAYCGNKMMGVTRRQSWRRKDGRRNRQVYRYYQCQSRNNQSLCGYHTWREQLLEGTVISQLKYALQAQPPPAPDERASDGSRQRKARASRESAEKNAERRFLQAVKRAARGVTKLPVLAEYLKELDDARRSTRAETADADPDATLDAWDSLDMEARRSFLLYHIDRITVEDERIDLQLVS